MFFVTHLQQITALKKENFNLKLRIYFMEERMQQKCDDSTEDIFKTVLYLLSMQKCVLASTSLSCFYVAPQCFNVAGDSEFPTKSN